MSAQKYPEIEYNAYFLALFTFLCILWTLGLYQFKEKVVSIHYMIAIVLYACWIESLANLIYYEKMNTYSEDYTPLGILTIVMEITRNVFSRVIVLLTALGYQITHHDIRMYTINIGVMSFIYAISLGIAGASENMKENYYT